MFKKGEVNLQSITFISVQEVAVAFIRMIQGMSFEEVKDLLKQKSGIMYGCTVSYYIFKAEAGADNSLKFYMM